jgi:FkbM family methyltransferase
MVYYHDFKNDQFLNEFFFGNEKDGYFVEIGACDGIENSCCYFFESELNWDGIAVEPSKNYSLALSRNRKRPEYSAIADYTIPLEQGGVLFYQSHLPVLSGLTCNLTTEKKGQVWETIGFSPYAVPTLTLFDLLEKHQAPNIIDYCAIDAEGSELGILSKFFQENCQNKDKYKVGVFSVEIDNNLSEINQLMTSNGYREEFNPYLRDMKFDGREITWERYYVNNSLF